MTTTTKIVASVFALRRRTILFIDSQIVIFSNTQAKIFLELYFESCIKSNFKEKIFVCNFKLILSKFELKRKPPLFRVKDYFIAEISKNSFQMAVAVGSSFLARSKLFAVFSIENVITGNICVYTSRWDKSMYNTSSNILKKNCVYL